jgi:hypothetical protein
MKRRGWSDELALVGMVTELSPFGAAAKASQTSAFLMEGPVRHARFCKQGQSYMCVLGAARLDDGSELRPSPGAANSAIRGT